MPVQLLDSPNGRRYSDADKEAAYLLWRTTAGRSLRKVAETLVMSASTVGSWQQAGGWVERAKREDAEDAAGVRSSIGGLVARHATAAFGNIVTLSETASDERVRFQASTWLCGVAGIAPVARAETSILARTAPPDDGYAIPSLAGKSVEELMRIEQEYRARRVAG